MCDQPRPVLGRPPLSLSGITSAKTPNPNPMSRSFAFLSLRPLLLAALFLAIGGAVHAQTVSLDFETVGQLTNNFAFLAANSTNPTTSTVYGEAAALGAGGGRGVDLVGSGDNTGVYTNRTFSFRPGQFLGASMKFKLKTATGSGRALSFGFLNTTNGGPGALTDFGSVYFTTIRLNTLGANTSTGRPSWPCRTAIPV